MKAKFGKEGGIIPSKAGVVQFSPVYGRTAVNLARLETLVAEAVHQGVGLLVLPEMAWTGYLWPKPEEIRPLAEVSGDGPSQDRVRGWALRWGLTLVFGFPEAAGSRLYNSQGCVGPDGRFLPVYRKTHLFDADPWWAEPGDTGYRQWDSPWGKLGSGICMDLNYPDLVEHHVATGTSVLAFSTNWLDEGTNVVPYWEQRLAGTEGRRFQGTALFANRGGEEFGVAYRGQSTIFHDGRVVATLPGKDDGVLVVDLPSEVRA